MEYLYYVRHGQTVWNVANKICGATDVELTEKGHEQAVMTGEEILKEGIKFDKIICSPLIRAVETARHISEVTGVEYEVEPRLIEQNFGRFESTPRDGKEFKEAKTHFIDHFDGGETMLHLAQRIYNLLDEIKNDDKCYLIVAHNGIARVVHSYFYDMTNEEFANFGMKNCAIKRYDFN